MQANRAKAACGGVTDERDQAMAGRRKTTDDKLAELAERQEQIQAQLDALKARKKAEDRRRETRRAFLVGTAILERVVHDAPVRDMLRTLLAGAKLRDADKAVLSDLMEANGSATDASTPMPSPENPATADAT